MTTTATTRVMWIDIAGNYKPGDQPPSGYSAWHAWAAVQQRAGLMQARCCQCSQVKYPQEMSGRTATICNQCVKSTNPPQGEE